MDGVLNFLGLKEQPSKPNEWFRTPGNKTFALIINVLHDRPGAEKDNEYLNELFPLCNFDYLMCHNLSTKGIISTVSQFKSTLEAHRGVMDGILVAVMSHGTTGDLFQCSDGLFLNLQTDVVDQFNGKNCKFLDEVPKVFLVNMCRGPAQDRGYYMSDSASSSDFFPWLKQKPETDGTSSGSSYTDTLICHAAYIADKAYRDEEGTFFIKTFCKIAKKRLSDGPEDIEKIIAQVNVEVRELVANTKEGIRWQSPIFLNVGYWSNKFILRAIKLEGARQHDQQQTNNSRPTTEIDGNTNKPDAIRINEFVNVLYNSTGFDNTWEEFVENVFDPPAAKFSSARKAKTQETKTFQSIIRDLVTTWLSSSKKEQRTIGYVIKTLENYHKGMKVAGDKHFTDLLETLEKKYKTTTAIDM